MTPIEAVMRGVLAGRIWTAAIFGCLVWGLSYVILPLAQGYKPIWEYDVPTLAKALSAHLVYGVGTAPRSERWFGRPK